MFGAMRIRTEAKLAAGLFGNGQKTQREIKRKVLRDHVDMDFDADVIRGGLTKNVGELQIGSIKVGQAARISVNAFKDEVLTGQVVAISPIAIVQQGDTTYTLVIELEQTDLNLWPGMTAQVDIKVDDQ